MIMIISSKLICCIFTFSWGEIKEEQWLLSDVLPTFCFVFIYCTTPVKGCIYLYCLSLMMNMKKTSDISIIGVIQPQVWWFCVLFVFFFRDKMLVIYYKILLYTLFFFLLTWVSLFHWLWLCFMLLYLKNWKLLSRLFTVYTLFFEKVKCFTFFFLKNKMIFLQYYCSMY